MSHKKEERERKDTDIKLSKTHSPNKKKIVSTWKPKDITEEEYATFHKSTSSNEEEEVSERAPIGTSEERRNVTVSQLYGKRVCVTIMTMIAPSGLELS